MSSFAIFEDESANQPIVVSDANVFIAKEKRQFGTVLADSNRELLQQKIIHSSVQEQQPSDCDLDISDDAQSFYESEHDIHSDEHDLINSSVPFPSLVSLDESKDSCLSTAILLSTDGYFDEIGSYLHQMEAKSQCKANYMSRQRDLTHAMRSVLVDWLVEVADEYKLTRRTLFLAVAIMDRFLSEMSVLRTKLQLLGATCMFVAAKFEEIYPPEASEFAYLTEDTYTVAQILKLERLVLRVLDYQLGFPTTDVMSDRIVAAAHIPQERAMLINYISELSLGFGDPFLQYLPSTIAAASICLSNICLGLSDDEIWPEDLQRLTGKKISDFYYCLVLLSDVMHQAPSNSNCKSVVSRYKSVIPFLPDRNRVAALCSRTETDSRDTFSIRA